MMGFTVGIRLTKRQRDLIAATDKTPDDRCNETMQSRGVFRCMLPKRHRGNHVLRIYMGGNTRVTCKWPQTPRMPQTPKKESK